MDQRQDIMSKLLVSLSLALVSLSPVFVINVN